MISVLNRNLRKFKIALAMGGSALFVMGSGPVARGALPSRSSAEEVEIRMSRETPSRDRGENLVFRSAKRPVVVPISFEVIEGEPRIQADALQILLGEIREHPRRLITIEVEGLPISFNNFPRSTRRKLLERGGPEFAASYDEFVARELVKLLDDVRAVQVKTALSVKGIPFDGNGKNDSLLNKRFALLIDRLSAFVLDRGVVVSSRTDEEEIFFRSFPNAIELADGRALIFPLNLGWRLAIEGRLLGSDTGTGNISTEGLANVQTGLDAATRLPGLNDVAVISDLDELGVAGRGGVSAGLDPVLNGGTNSNGVQGESASPAEQSAGLGSEGRGSGGGAALPFGLDGRVDEPPAEDEAGDEPPADDEAGDEPPADDEAGDDPPADDEAGDDPPADDEAGDDPPADDEAGDDPPADDEAGDDPPADDEAGDWNPGDEVDDGGDDAPGDQDQDEPPADDDEVPGGDEPPLDDALRVLDSGEGFDGDPEPAARVGDPAAAGYDCQAIARWDVVPYQLVRSNLSIGVVAFHRDGIDRVDFSLNGGPWKSIHEPAMNDRTGVKEYYAIISPESMPEGESEIRAIVYPNNGEPRVLAGPMGNGAWDVVGDEVPGEYSLFLRKNSAPPRIRYVSNAGSDDVGDGSIDAPFRTITWAAWDLVGRQVGSEKLADCEIRLFPGTYGGTYAANWPIRSAGTGRSGWLTVTGIEGSDVGDVVFTHSGSGEDGVAGPRWGFGNTRIKNVTIQPDPDWNPANSGKWIFYGKSPANLWLDGVVIEGSFLRPSQSGVRKGFDHYYSTNSIARECWDVPLAGEIQRDCLLDGIVADALRGGLVVNNRIRNHSREIVPGWESLGIHPDVFQIWARNGGDIENHIVFGLDATDLVGSQGLFLSDSPVFRDMAFVDVSINNTRNGLGESGASHVNLYWISPMKHGLVRNSAFNGGAYRYTPNGPWNQGDFTGEDVIFEGVRRLDRFTSEVLEEYFFPFPDGPSSTAWAGHYPGSPLPWVSWDSLVEYRE